MRQSVFPVDAHVERFAHEVLEAVDGVDGPALRVHVDGVDGHVEVLAVRLDAVLVVGVRREVHRVAGVGEVTAVVDGADRNIEETCGGDDHGQLFYISKKIPYTKNSTEHSPAIHNQQPGTGSPTHSGNITQN